MFKYNKFEMYIVLYIKETGENCLYAVCTATLKKNYH